MWHKGGELCLREILPVPETLECFKCVRVCVSHFWRSEERHELFTLTPSWLGMRKGRMRDGGDGERERDEGQKWEAGKRETERRKRHWKTRLLVSLIDAKGGAAWRLSLQEFTRSCLVAMVTAPCPSPNISYWYLFALTRHKNYIHNLVIWVI